MWRVWSAWAWVRWGNTGDELGNDISRLGYNKKGRHLAVRPNEQRGCMGYFFVGAAAGAVAAATAGAEAAATGAAGAASGGV